MNTPSQNWNPVGNPQISEPRMADEHDDRANTEYGRFENLASKLAQVPKSELEEKRQEA